MQRAAVVYLNFHLFSNLVRSGKKKLEVLEALLYAVHKCYAFTLEALQEFHRSMIFEAQSTLKSFLHSFFQSQNERDWGREEHMDGQK